MSVVLPAFNAARTLDATLHSLLAQTYPNLEIVVVDDGSVDETGEVLRAFGDRVRSLRQDNAGLPGARNAGCRVARGELIALMDADDLCQPERIALQTRVFQSLPATVLCSTGFSAFDHRGSVAESFGEQYYSQISQARGGLAAKYAELHRVSPAAQPESAAPASEALEVLYGDIYPELAFGNFVHPPTVMVRRDALFAAGLFDENIRYNCDWECFVRLAQVGPFAHIPRPLLAYRLSESQMSSSSGNRGRGALDLIGAFEKISRSDEGLMQTQRHRVMSCLREFHIDAARAVVDFDRSRTARLLWRLVAMGGVDRHWVATFAKLLLPGSSTAFLRRLVSSRRGQKGRG